MIDVLSVENMRKSDARTIAGGISGRELMYRAGSAVLENVSVKAPVAIVCGTGNNAGDGYVIALLLRRRSIPCTIFLLREKYSEDGAYYFDQCFHSGIPVIYCWETISFHGFATIFDCIFGTGFHGKVQGLAKTVIEAINKSDAYVVSVDINSGLNGDNGLCDICVRSDITVSIGGFQPGHFLNMAKDCMWEVVNCDIGIRPAEPPYHLLEMEDFQALVPERKHYSHKATYGYMALIGGSLAYSGAIRLAAMASAAMRSGAGVVKLAAPESLCSLLIPEILESTLYPMPDKDGNLVFDESALAGLMGGVKSIAFGMGIGISEEIQKMLAFLLEHYTGSLVIDADGLTALAALDPGLLQNTAARVILTPHVKEFSRLTNRSTDEILSAPIELARDYAAENHVVLLLKGPTTIITDGTSVNLVNTGCPGMATAGSGDVLSGILSALCSYVPDSLLAASAAAYINGKAGEYAQEKYGSVSMIASDTAACIKDVIRALFSLHK